jgi:uncharacterized protein (DUF1015 family)
MAEVTPFRALRPRDDLAGDVIAPPYDVLTDDEARTIARNRRSFVRVTRSEVDLPSGTDAHSELAYRTARANLDSFVRESILVQDAEPTYYLYHQVMGNHRQTGIIAGASVAEYDDGRIAKHEFTRPDKEDDRTHHMDVLDAQVGLVFLAFRPTARLRALVERATAAPPAWSVTTDDGVQHVLWPAPAPLVPEFRAAFAEVPRLYVCDGHHRSAAASRIHAQRKDAASAHFLAGLFPSDELQVLPYNRVVQDTRGLGADELFRRLEGRFSVHPGGPPAPMERGSVSVYLEGRWTTIRARPELRTGDPVKDLDVSVLQDHVLGPILGIDDPRRSQRISFVGGIRGPQALVEQVDAQGGIAFSMYPTSLEELFAVADAGQVMPPKSTWFEPKLREGVAIRSLR